MKRLLVIVASAFFAMQAASVSHISDEEIVQYLTMHDEQWGSMTYQAQRARIEAFRLDEQTFEDMVTVLKSDMPDNDKIIAFEGLFAQLHDKHHRIDSGTVLAWIINFTRDDVQRTLVRHVLEQGVSTKRIPGEFLGDTYYPNKSTAVARAKHRVVSWFKRTRTDITQAAQGVADRFTTAYERVAKK